MSKQKATASFAFVPLILPINHGLSLTPLAVKHCLTTGLSGTLPNPLLQSSVALLLLDLHHHTHPSCNPALPILTHPSSCSQALPYYRNIRHPSSPPAALLCAFEHVGGHQGASTTADTAVSTSAQASRADMA